MRMGWSVNYNQPPPPEYRCGSCGASRVKLWREYQTFLDHQTLECVDCAGKSQDKDTSRTDERGRTPFVIDDVTGWHSTIGWRAPAIPTEEGDTFWGFTTSPPAAVRWWEALPTRAASHQSEEQEKNR